MQRKRGVSGIRRLKVPAYELLVRPAAREELRAIAHTHIHSTITVIYNSGHAIQPRQICLTHLVCSVAAHSKMRSVPQAVDPLFPLPEYART